MVGIDVLLQGVLPSVYNIVAVLHGALPALSQQQSSPPPALLTTSKLYHRRRCSVVMTLNEIALVPSSLCVCVGHVWGALSGMLLYMAPVGVEVGAGKGGKAEGDGRRAPLGSMWNILQ